ncbi:putative Dedicator of cytokinesis protein 9 [Blattamonas nauphoetae]|uniref:Dedicator of cytokinesis protein 9 n=1 Tax=Blattamonas nauphoetae TaxID=2049346 RepID=A0ABQ9XYX1_9EUKA|nr:putative Dedicator of cytokinesis protein 9 [Blattamonas nauphoetae]
MSTLAQAKDSPTPASTTQESNHEAKKNLTPQSTTTKLYFTSLSHLQIHLEEALRYFRFSAPFLVHPIAKSQQNHASQPNLKTYEGSRFRQGDRAGTPEIGSKKEIEALKLKTQTENKALAPFRQLFAFHALQLVDDGKWELGTDSDTPFPADIPLKIGTTRVFKTRKGHTRTDGTSRNEDTDAGLLESIVDLVRNPDSFKEIPCSMSITLLRFANTTLLPNPNQEIKLNNVQWIDEMGENERSIETDKGSSLAPSTQNMPVGQDDNWIIIQNQLKASMPLNSFVLSLKNCIIPRNVMFTPRPFSPPASLCHTLFITPRTLDFSLIAKTQRARNILIQATLHTTSLSSPAILPTLPISSFPAAPLYSHWAVNPTSVIFSSMKYHDESPSFSDEFRIVLPLQIPPDAVILFTFYQVSRKNALLSPDWNESHSHKSQKERQKVLSLLGHSALPLFDNLFLTPLNPPPATSASHSSPQALPSSLVTHRLPVLLPSQSPLTTLQNACAKPIPESDAQQYMLDGAPLFTVATRYVSSLLPPSPLLRTLLTHNTTSSGTAIKKIISSFTSEFKTVLSILREHAGSDAYNSLFNHSGWMQTQSLIKGRVWQRRVAATETGGEEWTKVGREDEKSRKSEDEKSRKSEDDSKRRSPLETPKSHTPIITPPISNHPLIGFPAIARSTPWNTTHSISEQLQIHSDLSSLQSYSQHFHLLMNSLLFLLVTTDPPLPNAPATGQNAQAVSHAAPIAPRTSIPPITTPSLHSRSELHYAFTVFTDVISLLSISWHTNRHEPLVVSREKNAKKRNLLWLERNFFVTPTLFNRPTIAVDYLENHLKLGLEIRQQFGEEDFHGELLVMGEKDDKEDETQSIHYRLMKVWCLLMIEAAWRAIFHMFVPFLKSNVEVAFAAEKQKDEEWSRKPATPTNHQYSESTSSIASLPSPSLPANQHSVSSPLRATISATSYTPLSSFLSTASNLKATNVLQSVDWPKQAQRLLPAFTSSIRSHTQISPASDVSFAVPFQDGLESYLESIDVLKGALTEEDQAYVDSFVQELENGKGGILKHCLPFKHNTNLAPNSLRMCELVAEKRTSSPKNSLSEYDHVLFSWFLFGSVLKSLFLTQAKQFPSKTPNPTNIPQPIEKRLTLSPEFIAILRSFTISTALFASFSPYFIGKMIVSELSRFFALLWTVVDVGVVNGLIVLFLAHCHPTTVREEDNRNNIIAAASPFSRQHNQHVISLLIDSFWPPLLFLSFDLFLTQNCMSSALVSNPNATPEQQQSQHFQEYAAFRRTYQPKGLNDTKPVVFFVSHAFIRSLFVCFDHRQMLRSQGRRDADRGNAKRDADMNDDDNWVDVAVKCLEKTSNRLVCTLINSDGVWESEGKTQTTSEPDEIEELLKCQPPRAAAVHPFQLMLNVLGSIDLSADYSINTALQNQQHSQDSISKASSIRTELSRMLFAFLQTSLSRSRLLNQLRVTESLSEQDDDFTELIAFHLIILWLVRNSNTNVLRRFFFTIPASQQTDFALLLGQSLTILHPNIISVLIAKQLDMKQKRKDYLGLIAPQIPQTSSPANTPIRRSSSSLAIAGENTQAKSVNEWRKSAEVRERVKWVVDDLLGTISSALELLFVFALHRSSAWSPFLQCPPMLTGFDIIFPPFFTTLFAILSSSAKLHPNLTGEEEEWNVWKLWWELWKSDSTSIQTSRDDWLSRYKVTGGVTDLARRDTITQLWISLISILKSTLLVLTNKQNPSKKLPLSLQNQIVSLLSFIHYMLHISAPLLLSSPHTTTRPLFTSLLVCFSLPCEVVREHAIQLLADIALLDLLLTQTLIHFSSLMLTCVSVLNQLETEPLATLHSSLDRFNSILQLFVSSLSETPTHTPSDNPFLHSLTSLQHPLRLLFIPPNSLTFPLPLSSLILSSDLTPRLHAILDDMASLSKLGDTDNDLKAENAADLADGYAMTPAIRIAMMERQMAILQDSPKTEDECAILMTMMTAVVLDILCAMWREDERFGLLKKIKKPQHLPVRSDFIKTRPTLPSAKDRLTQRLRKEYGSLNCVWDDILSAIIPTFTLYTPAQLTSILSDNDTVETFLSSGFFTFSHLVSIASQAADALRLAGLHEFAVLLWRIVYCLAEAVDDVTKMEEAADGMGRENLGLVIAQPVWVRIKWMFYRVGLHGTPFKKEDGVEYILKETDFLSLGDTKRKLVEKYKKRFGVEPIIIATPQMRELTDDEKKIPHIHLTAVKPFFPEEEEDMRENDLDQVVGFTKYFFDSAFIKTGTLKDAEMERIWLRRTILETVHPHPFSSRRVCVKPGGMHVHEHSPAQNAVMDLHQRVSDIRKATREDDVKHLMPLISGGIAPQVNVGATAVITCFLEKNKETTSEEDKAMIRDVFVRFVESCREGLLMLREVERGEKKSRTSVPEGWTEELKIKFNELLERLEEHLGVMPPLRWIEEEDEEEKLG